MEFRGAKGYSQDNAPSLKPTDRTYKEGMYKVSKDINPGEYKLTPDTGAINSYVEVSKNSKGTTDSIVSNDNFKN